MLGVLWSPGEYSTNIPPGRSLCLLWSEYKKYTEQRVDALVRHKTNGLLTDKISFFPLLVSPRLQGPRLNNNIFVMQKEKKVYF
jgi:hypothetical protein